MRIGELAHQAGVDVQTVRYYEREGLLAAPSRTASGYRAYGPEHLERLNFVRHCRSLDMPLAEIKRLDRPVERRARVVRAGRCAGPQPTSSACRPSARRSKRWKRSSQALSAQCASGHRVADCGILEELIHAAHGEACACHPHAE